MDKKVERYYQLKQEYKAIEQELMELRGEIMAYCEGQGISELEADGYKVKVVTQDRKEYDDNRLYEALPDPGLWRMLSRPDPAKISSLLKLKVLSEEKLKDTFTIKTITLLQVDKT